MSLRATSPSLLVRLASLKRKRPCLHKVSLVNKIIMSFELAKKWIKTGAMNYNENMYRRINSRSHDDYFGHKFNPCRRTLCF